jgi:Ni,Fe-hydrogenase III large subunit/Ni,Fe-hydrogenase III component G
MMRIESISAEFVALPAPLPAWLASVSAGEWRGMAATMRAEGGRLVSLWASDRRPDGQGFVVSAAYALSDGLAIVEHRLDESELQFPDISSIFPAAGRMQRAVFDLLGLRAYGESGVVDTRPWLNHGAWPPEFFPLRHDSAGDTLFPGHGVSDYPFVKVSGDGVHEIPVGPVHAGIIEPGHFRFSIVGEKVLRLEQRLGYKHKGIDKRFESLMPVDAVRLAGRVSGDSTVAFSWAYSMALESIAKTTVSSRAQWLRALLLERERIANHLGDLGALGNDAAFSFGLTNFMRLKEDWLRLNKELFGHRFMMDCVVPGGVMVDVDAAGAERIRQQCVVVEAEVRVMQGIYEAHSGLQDRFITTGIVKPDLATELGLTGFAARASGLAFDLRNDYPQAPYDQFEFAMASHRNGDVAARVIVRFDEIYESMRLLRAMLPALPAGEPCRAVSADSLTGVGYGWVEGWRGEVLVALELQAGKIRRCHCHDPSWHNWPVLEHAVIGNIVPDFPLINKSFNLSYAGHDR